MVGEIVWFTIGVGILVIKFAYNFFRELPM